MSVLGISTPRSRTSTRDEESYVKTLEEQRDDAVRRAAEAEVKASEEACKVKQLSQERTQLMLQLSETENSLEQRMASAESALVERLREMEGVIANVEAERDQLAEDLEACRQRLEASSIEGSRSERKQIVEDLRAIKSDAENSLEQRMEAAERELVLRLRIIEARVAKAEASAACKPSIASTDEQEVIEALKKENTELSVKLESAWMKMDEMESMLQDERATFWEELDLMRLEKNNCPQSNQQHVAQHAVVAAPFQPSARVLSSPTSATTPTIVRYSTPAATPSPRQLGPQVPVIKATPGIMPSGQRVVGLYP